MEAEMISAANALEFERAALLRDQIAELKSAAGLESQPHAKKTKNKNARKSLIYNNISKPSKNNGHPQSKFYHRTGRAAQNKKPFKYQGKPR
jgi:excinuclease UvrABC nuclease subunit